MGRGRLLRKTNHSLGPVIRGSWVCRGETTKEVHGGGRGRDGGGVEGTHSD